MLGKFSIKVRHFADDVKIYAEIVEMKMQSINKARSIY